MSGQLTISKITSYVNNPLTVLSSGTGAIGIYSGGTGAITLQSNGAGNVSVYSTSGTATVCGTATTLNATSGNININGYSNATITSTTGTAKLISVAGATQVNGVSVAISSTGSTTNLTLTTAANAEIKSTLNNGKISLTCSDSGGGTGSITITKEQGSNPTIGNLGIPSISTDAATKSYVDSLVVGLNFKNSCEIRATDTSSPFNSYGYTYNAGIITGASTGVTEIGGFSSINFVNRRILVLQSNVTDATHAGIYTLTTAGNVGVAAVLTRATDADTATELNSAYTFIERGNFMNTAYVQTNLISDINVDVQSWVVFSSTGSNFGGVLNIGPLYISANPESSTGVKYMASVNQATSSLPFKKNFQSGGLIFQSNALIQDGSTDPIWGPSLYMTSPNATNVGQKGCFRIVTRSNGNNTGADVDPTSTTSLCFQQFCWRSGDATITNVSGTLDIITVSASIKDGTTLARDHDEIMFYGTAANSQTWVGDTLDPRVMYFIRDLASNGLQFKVSTTVNGAVKNLLTANGSTGTNGFFLWRSVNTMTSV